MVRARQLADIFEEEDPECDEDPESAPAYSGSNGPIRGPTARRIQTRQSPYFDVFHDYHAVRITVDSGATG